MSSALRLARLHHTHQENEGQDCKAIEGNRQLPLLLDTQLWSPLLAPPKSTRNGLHAGVFGSQQITSHSSGASPVLPAMVHTEQGAAILPESDKNQ